MKHLLPLLLLAALLTAPPILADVTIPDPGLESAIRNNLGLGPTDPITEAALAGMEELEAGDYGIENLTGLEYCTSLTRLFMHNNQISDLTPLQGLTSVWLLWLPENCILDLSALLDLPDLEALNVDTNPLSYTAVTVQIPQLTGNGVSVDFYTLRNTGCPVGSVTIPDPALASALHHTLNLGPTDPITETALLWVDYLNATNYGIVDLTGLEYCTNLTGLWLDYNQISDLTPLQGLTNLTELDLDINQISDLTPLQGLTSLTQLQIRRNHISDLTPLQGLSSLTELHLDSNHISDLTGLQGLSTLTKLRLPDNEISNLTPLQGLTNLTLLYLDKNCISELRALLDLSNLSNLKVDYNPLSDNAITVQIPQLTTNGVYVVFYTYSDENCLPSEGEEESVENPEGCPKPLGGTYLIGSDLCLCVPLPVSGSSTYAWSKDGDPLIDGGRVFGTHARTLQILMLTAEDSGLYSCTYDDGAKAVHVFNANVAVVKAMPALGTLGLIVLAVAGASLGLLARKKRV